MLTKRLEIVGTFPALASSELINLGTAREDLKMMNILDVAVRTGGRDNSHSAEINPLQITISRIISRLTKRVFINKIFGPFKSTKILPRC